MAETTIPCSKDTRERVKDIKRGGETYEEVLNRLLESHENE